MQHDITVRHMDLSFPDDIESVCVEGAPEESYGLIAFSLLLPSLEPYLIRFEAFTTATALFSFEQGFAGGMHPAVRDLYSWHLVEEIEHRTVAFDVYEHVLGVYPYRLSVGLFAQWHMLRWTARVAAYMLECDREALPRYGGREGRRERGRAQLRMSARHLLPRVLKTYLPWYTPHRIEVPEQLRELARHYSDMAIKTS